VEHARANNATYYEGDTISGSTANVILITKDFIYCANSGDSRAVAAIKSQ
jgi:serine/threonine protein phosphatase PrpC